MCVMPLLKIAVVLAYQAQRSDVKAGKERDVEGGSRGKGQSEGEGAGCAFGALVLIVLSVVVCGGLMMRLLAWFPVRREGVREPLGGGGNGTLLTQG